MVHNITDKVVKRLVQVTSQKQDGENRVGLIKSETAYKVSQKMAEAAAARPDIVGTELNEIAKTDPEILESVLQVMEVNNLLDSSVDLLPDNSQYLIQLGDKSQQAVTAESPNGVTDYWSSIHRIAWIEDVEYVELMRYVLASKKVDNASRRKANKATLNDLHRRLNSMSGFSKHRMQTVSRARGIVLSLTIAVGVGDYLSKYAPKPRLMNHPKRVCRE